MFTREIILNIARVRHGTSVIVKYNTLIKLASLNEVMVKINSKTFTHLH